MSLGKREPSKWIQQARTHNYPPCRMCPAGTGEVCRSPGNSAPRMPHAGRDLVGVSGVEGLVVSPTWTSPDRLEAGTRVLLHLEDGRTFYAFKRLEFEEGQ